MLAQRSKRTIQCSPNVTHFCCRFKFIKHKNNILVNAILGETTLRICLKMDKTHAVESLVNVFISDGD